ncbi:MAG: LLM class flavin-dependent oxidoreductase [Steroidobacteraceae bacterium]
MRVDIAGLTGSTHHLTQTELTGHVAALEALGYSGVWFNEFHFADSVGHPSTLLLAAALFAGTSRIRIGTSVLVLPLHHPLLLAEMLAQLSVQSAGRLDVGVGSGTSTATLQALGISRAEAGEAFRFALSFIRRAWREAVEMPPNPLWRAGQGSVGPLLQGAEPPLYVGGRSMETCLFTASQGLPLILSSNFPPADVLGAYHARLADPAVARRTSFARFVCIAETRSKAEGMVDDLRSDLRAEEVEIAQRHGRPASLGFLERERFLAQHVIVGTPEDCLRQLHALERTLGYGQIRLSFADARRADAEPSPSTRLFAREVLPALQED